MVRDWLQKILFGIPFVLNLEIPILASSLLASEPTHSGTSEKPATNSAPQKGNLESLKLIISLSRQKRVISKAVTPFQTEIFVRYGVIRCPMR
jgi:hypothetical protein